ncbi:MAG: GNAT family N-acetyltransferase [Thermodesulfobacteriota bacterium]
MSESKQLVSVRIVQKDFAGLASLSGGQKGLFPWRHLFSRPEYMAVWLSSFPPKGEVYLALIEENNQLIGIAPLVIAGQKASFVGHSSVCDYLDFSIVAGQEPLFYQALLADLDRRGVTLLDLRCLRPESTVLAVAKDIVEGRGGFFQLEPDGVAMEMDLPESWDGYLALLPGKERHEIRRKLRRLEQSGPVNIRISGKTPATEAELDRFFTMFRQSRSGDKSRFMDTAMESYFRLLIKDLGKIGLLKIYLLEIRGDIAAASLCFAYQETMFLYNSCYDPAYKELSVGLLCNLFSIRDSIAIGHRRYDFLKGDEPYKRRLGGREVRLSRARITLGRGGGNS